MYLLNRFMFTAWQLIKLIFITFLPGIELRGAIPYGIAIGMDPWIVIPTVTVINILLIPVFYAALRVFWRFVKHWEIVKKHVHNLRVKSKPYVDKYGSYGIFFFVSVPLPGSGVYTGVLIAWLLGMSQKKAFIPIMLGVIVASALVSLFTLTTVSLLGIIS